MFFYKKRQHSNTSRFQGLDAVTAIELVEHLEPDALAKFPQVPPTLICYPPADDLDSFGTIRHHERENKLRTFKLYLHFPCGSVHGLIIAKGYGTVAYIVYNGGRGPHT